jgi:hypothetical protein
MTVAVTLYDSIKAVHVMAVVAAFGVFFAWPVLVRGTAEAHQAVMRTLQVLVTPAATLVLVTGADLATKRSYWSEVRYACSGPPRVCVADP